MFYAFVIFGRKSIINSLETAIEIQKDTEKMRNEILNNKNKSMSEKFELAGEGEDNEDGLSSNKNPEENQEDLGQNEKESSKSLDSKNSKTIIVFAKIPILQLLKYKQFVFAMMSGSLGYFIGSFVEPILALQLKETYHFKDSAISLFFVVHFLGYLIFSPLVQYIPKRFEKRLIMMFGSFMAFITLIFYGPSKMLNFPQDWHVMMVGLILMG